MSTQSLAVFCAAGIGIVITSAVLAATDPAFARHALDAGLVVLAVLALGTIVAPLAALFTAPGPRADNPLSAPRGTPGHAPARHTGTTR